jgi:hypothetical protein
VAAVLWLKDNIGVFGGDSSRITLSGHGTGAALVNLLMISPIAAGKSLHSPWLHYPTFALSDRFGSVIADPLPFVFFFSVMNINGGRWLTHYDMIDFFPIPCGSI